VVAGFALVPLQQHRLIRIAPDQQNGALALNACAIYAGQGFGTVLGSLVLGYASLAALGGAGAACAAAALIASILSARLSAKAS
jgi:predicted MFS family arabinose efflux permease